MSILIKLVAKTNQLKYAKQKEADSSGIEWA